MRSILIATTIILAAFAHFAGGWPAGVAFPDPQMLAAPAPPLPGMALAEEPADWVRVASVLLFALVVVWRKVRQPLS